MLSVCFAQLDDGMGFDFETKMKTEENKMSQRTMDELFYGLQVGAMISDDDHMIDVLRWDVVVAPLSSFQGVIKRYSVENLSELDDVVNWDYDAVEVVGALIAGGYGPDRIYCHYDTLISG
jgi:hypothetical protein